MRTGCSVAVAYRGGHGDATDGGSRAVDPAVAARRGGAAAACGWGVGWRRWCIGRRRIGLRRGRVLGGCRCAGGFWSRRAEELVGAADVIEDRARVVDAGGALGFFDGGEAGVAPELDAGAGADDGVAAVFVVAAVVGVEVEGPAAVEALGDERFVIGGVSADVALE